MGDPFYTVEGEVQDALSTLETLFHRWRELLGADLRRSSQLADEFIYYHEEIRKTLDNTRMDLADLDESITVITSNRSKYSQSDEELARRRKFVADMRTIVGQLAKEFGSDKAQRRLQQAEQVDLLDDGKPTRPASKYERVQEAANDDFINENLQQRQMLLQEQDRGIDDIAAEVGRIKHIGHAINDELERQTIEIEELEYAVDNTTARLSAAQKALNVLERATNDKGTCTIVILLFVLVVLLVMVIRL